MRVGILGLGHVGLVNLCGFAKKGFLTIGFGFAGCSFVAKI